MYVPSYDHPDIWEGHSTIVDEIVATGDTSRRDSFFCKRWGPAIVASSRA